MVKYGRCHFRISYILDGKGHMYLPDILIELIDGTKKIIEIKSMWQVKHETHGRAIEAKAFAAEEFCRQNGLQYEIWTEQHIGIK